MDNSAAPITTSDTAIDREIGIVLRVGVLTSAFTVLVGGFLFLLRQGHQTPDYRVFHGVPANLTTVTGIVHGALHGQPLAIIQLGMLLLIATPVARVLFSVLGFALARDFLYVSISTLVLFILLYSLIWH